MELTTESQRVKLALSRLHDETWRALETSIEDAQKMGYGFVAIKKGVGSLDLTVRHLPWHMVVDILREMGALGGGGIR